MRLRSFVTLLALLICCSISAQTTVEKQTDRAANRAKNRAEQKAQSKVDNTVDRAVDDAFNAIGGLFKKKNKKSKQDKKSTNTQPADQTQSEAEAEAQAMDMVSSMLGGGKDWEPYTNPHTFSLRMHITETKRNGKSETNMIDMGVMPKQFAIRMADEKEQTTRMILDTQDGMTTMITTDKKGETSGVRMRLPSMKATVEETAEETMDRYTFERTGERRTVEGYDCERIIVTDTKTGDVTKSWVTKELPVTSMDIFGGMMKAFGARAPQPQGGSAMQAPFEGFPIESTATQDGKTYVTKFQNLRFDANIDKSLFNTEGVQLVGFGSWN